MILSVFVLPSWIFLLPYVVSPILLDHLWYSYALASIGVTRNPDVPGVKIGIRKLCHPMLISVTIQMHHWTLNVNKHRFMVL
jgi:hypothetical protein